MRSPFLLAIIFTLLIILALPFPSPADWPGQGVPICTEEGNQLDPRITSDGAGGAVDGGWRTQIRRSDSGDGRAQTHR